MDNVDHSGQCSILCCLCELLLADYWSYPFPDEHLSGSSFTYAIQAHGWLIITIKDNKTIEIVFPKNESRTMIVFVSEANHKTSF
jgi:hypothetical protein